MAPTLPLPIRIAVGLVATGLDRLRRLPQDLPGLSVTLAGQAARASMRIQQEIAELANRGDELLSQIVDRPEEHPAWARFDDAEDADIVGDTTAANGDPFASADGEWSPEAEGAGSYVTAGDPADDPTPSGKDVLRGVPAGSADLAPLEGYDEMRAAQLRARLRGLAAEDIAAVLDYERAHRARAAFLTLLENRLATVRSGTDGSFAGAAHGDEDP